MYCDIIFDALEEIKGDYVLTNDVIRDMIVHMLYVIGLSDMCLPDGSLIMTKDKLMETCVKSVETMLVKQNITKKDLEDILSSVTVHVLNPDYAMVEIYDESAVITMLAKIMYAIETIDYPKNASVYAIPRINQMAYELYQQRMHSRM